MSMSARIVNRRRRTHLPQMVAALVLATTISFVGPTGASPAGAKTGPSVQGWDVPVRTGTTSQRMVVSLSGPTELLGVSWLGDPGAVIEVAVPDGRGWGAWQPAEAEASGPDAGSVEHRTGRAGTSPIWLGDSVRKVSIRVLSGSVSDLRLQAVHSPVVDSPAMLAPSSPRAAASTAGSVTSAGGRPASHQPRPVGRRRVVAHLRPGL